LNEQRVMLGFDPLDNGNGLIKKESSTSKK